MHFLTCIIDDCMLDIFFLIDGSESVVPDDFGSLLDFVDTSMRRIHTTIERAQFAVGEYSTDFHIFSDAFGPLAEGLADLKQVNQSNGVTNTVTAVGGAIQFMLDNNDPDTLNVLVLLTDGQTSRQERPSIPMVVQAMLDTGIRAVAVGLGSEGFDSTNPDELMMFANDFNDPGRFWFNGVDLMNLEPSIQPLVDAVIGRCDRKNQHLLCEFLLVL